MASDPLYGQDHQYFVDGPVMVSTERQMPGHHYLVGALGRGGKGLFGLDVTDPDAFDADDVLWERTGGTNMGEVLGEPLVVTLNDADRTKAVVVSNGVNSPDGSATLFVLKISDGSVIKEIEDVWLMRRVTIQARERCASKNAAGASHHASRVARSAASRLPLSSA